MGSLETYLVAMSFLIVGMVSPPDKPGQDPELDVTVLPLTGGCPNPETTKPQFEEMVKNKTILRYDVTCVPGPAYGAMIMMQQKEEGEKPDL